MNLKSDAKLRLFWGKSKYQGKILVSVSDSQEK